LRGPAGIPIGAVTPEEIALSILADIVQARRRKGAAKARMEAAE
jgi:xanthine dehydrogenase accessory factor